MTEAQKELEAAHRAYGNANVDVAVATAGELPEALRKQKAAFRRVQRAKVVVQTEEVEAGA